MCGDIFAIFLCFVMSHCEFMVIEKQKDVIYTGHVAFEIFSIPMWSHCAQLCTRLQICKSINFISLNKTCQINVAEPNRSTSCLTKSVGDSFVAASALPKIDEYLYKVRLFLPLLIKELAGICKGHTCNITEICVPKSKSEGYQCHPLIGYRIVPPNVQIPQSSYDVIIGQSVTLVCLVTSHLPITDVTWKKNVNNSVSTIDSGGSAHLYSGGNVKSPSLIISNVTQHDIGTYICSATNMIETRSSNTITVVLHLPPNVHIPLTSYEITFGQSVTLVCVVTSNLPITGVTWKKNVSGSVSMIDPDDNSSLYSGGNVDSPSLIILNVTANDTGTYICSASNLVGTRSSDTISLVVNYPPNVHISQSSYDVINGQSVTLVCIVTSELPLTGVTWKKNDGGCVSTIDSDDSSSLYSGGNVGSPSLIIFNVTQNDTGTYICSASNKVDTRSSDTITLVIHTFPRDCSDLGLLSGSGVYRIYPATSVEFDVYCEKDIMCERWTVFQQRFDGTYGFYRNWNAYKIGFGDLNGEFWLGNDYLHYITSSGQYRLRVELEAYDGSTAYAEYSTFSIGDSQSDYILNVGGYSGNAGENFQYHDGMKFSTFDRDNDLKDENCANIYIGAWWYDSCYDSNLNGRYGVSNDTTGIVWIGFQGFSSLKATKMMIQRYY
ncbi:Fibrinogen-like protein A,Ryncolin-4,Angiopoietin-related protein 1,Ficolin-3,Ficolin-1-B,Ficolin-2,Ryncolin-1,Tenascin-R,Fibrinogen-like protein 1,Angiopoietin-1,Tenascin-N,Ryncolin-3,Tenascin,Fibroleukin,Fibrinogen C domain-containing protein 1,Ryncolin-2,Angiopoietin-related protein 2,Microfibril-associated glycoprotein 4,Fibrinogen alpha chain,Ficolin-1-A,Ficolin-1,Angiopoietin-4 [Mytilus coruscus]|uniref:Fibrinogen C-terminal domain-containing protein n=1 Tax=Mytilus coruscus TaxID=42192 RepID=A0A6J8D8F0_MYTCO|nr:Fibrinogen-like protein A,Ryncolin-4,Angiopoietin-related protein 1,Ficolin-3,Ficolin-1-B,Ficolin-2,Ryncolin-1,Tenascin-R,Fibrinogen-like protein 1,Angiopoietin-1,Tenascin-N,Ryncolin-3,Tenascin,Fibroleukin,Fibrinogen C domain-containing protein 1,Ryncolin-2,Angiopoietin-related protein 2,Microfibril-associated glycoprotein 4,Fibrinogen alpha chain,Ficolin-1-A,Ficolin-1,Angiopoietin-4 [Mytilus coruscus]